MPLQKIFEFIINLYFLMFWLNNKNNNSKHFYQISLQNLNIQIEKNSLFENHKFLLFFTQKKTSSKKAFFYIMNYFHNK